ncbi:hypothetical protein NS365_12485 [Aureimonas ureilytica]|uniref:Uncharacterized protein n=1 Tax=Aureimonas ureilytica TaxID=401562 RepID=A0A175RMD7_9HYPH|nr:hypothetical protein [Aureimonas ureilytica]KTR04876.1 hypothetical protein NS365_12485 [Aureimonas ureilytica]
MRDALTAELRETARIISHFLPLARVLRTTAEFAAVAGMVGAIGVYAIGTTTPAPRGVLMIAEAGG